MSNGAGPYGREPQNIPEIFRMIEENEQLKNKLETQNMEMGALKSQLFLTSQGNEDGQKKSTRDLYQKKGSKTAKSPRTNQHISGIISL